VSVPLKDLGRFAISESTHAALEAESAAFGRSMQDIAREVLQQWADRKAHGYKVYARRVLANGMQAELPGFEPEDNGAVRKGAR